VRKARQRNAHGGLPEVVLAAELGLGNLAARRNDAADDVAPYALVRALRQQGYSLAHYVKF
jgi:hypothetical protein